MCIMDVIKKTLAHLDMLCVSNSGTKKNPNGDGV